MASVDYFLKLDGIKGESKADGHKDEMEISSFSFGASQSGSFSSGGGGGAGKVHMQDFHFTIPTNTASPKLMLACASGKHIPTGVLTCRKAGTKQQEYYKVTFTDLLVSSYQTGGSHGDILPVDQISLNFASIKMEYKEQSKDGTLGGVVAGGWDLKSNTEKN